MSPKYKLIYFDASGAGEAIRYLFSYGKMDFEDVRLKFEDWPSEKKSVPFSKVPILEIEGKQINQSISICRYLAKQMGLAGNNFLEALEIDALADTVADIRHCIYTYGWLTPEREKSKKRDELLRETLPIYFSRLETIVQNNNGYLVNGKLSYADVVLAATEPFLSIVMQTDLTSEYPNLKNLVKKVENLDGIKEWIRTRPKTPF